MAHRPLKLAVACGVMAATSLSAHAAERALEKQVVVNATLDQTWAAWTPREGITSFGGEWDKA